MKKTGRNVFVDKKMPWPSNLPSRCVQPHVCFLDVGMRSYLMRTYGRLTAQRTFYEAHFRNMFTLFAITVPEQVALHHPRNSELAASTWSLSVLGCGIINCPSAIERSFPRNFLQPYTTFQLHRLMYLHCKSLLEPRPESPALANACGLVHRVHCLECGVLFVS